MSSPIFKVGLIGVVGFVLLVIIGSILSGGKANLKTQSITLKLHLDGTSEVISDYQKNVKSSNLRSSSASLYSVLTNTSREVTDYLTTKYAYKNGSEDKKIKDQAKLEKDGLEADLFEAKINGTLDRIYALKMAYEISMLMTEEAEIYNATGDSSLRSILESSYNSLDTLYGKFNEFSETK